MVVIAGFDRCGLDRAAAKAWSADVVFAQLRFDHAQQVPFDLRADDAFPAALRKPLQRLAQYLARREMEWPAVIEIFIAQDPTDAVGPWQNAEGCWIGDDGNIGGA